MLEFLSSIKLDQLADTLAFTLHNQIHQIHVDTIYDIIGALKERYTYSEKERKMVTFIEIVRTFGENSLRRVLIILTMQNPPALST